MEGPLGPSNIIGGARAKGPHPDPTYPRLEFLFEGWKDPGWTPPLGPLLGVKIVPESF